MIDIVPAQNMHGRTRGGSFEASTAEGTFTSRHSLMSGRASGAVQGIPSSRCTSEEHLFLAIRHGGLLGRNSSYLI